ncbi:cyclase family protein [Occultella glacieicola]|uniref:Cyclase family protein n=1 Tax=Occultella glacieicola TaxID=2518684 RepID=A0ABY2E0E7_9MICO|nr:cyclase family protein [Occultella glacieicola]TDE90892.1 cyclase family protein [Occultella glacieicola]
MDLTAALTSGAVRVIDLTAPLTAQTPILELPEPWVNTVPFELTEVAHFDERGPAWHCNVFTTGEHTGTHLDAPKHWITGKDGEDVSQIPPEKLVAPAVVVDVSDEVALNPDFLLEPAHLRAWEVEHGAITEPSWLVLRTGWAARADDAVAFLNNAEDGPHTPGPSTEAARFVAEHPHIIGMAVETVGTDAGQAGSFDPPYPGHNLLLGAGKYGLTQLRNLESLPTRGAVLIAAPLPIVGGTASPARVLALVPTGA